MQTTDKVKEEFLKTIDDFGSDPYNLQSHVLEVEKWAKYLLKRHPEADSEVVLLAVWLHDIGHYPITAEIDHAVRSEERGKKVLEKLDCPKDRIEKVLHCVRAHSNIDISPDSLEAKIVAFADSASHLTDAVYFRMAKDNKEGKGDFDVAKKTERDFKKLELFPEVQTELKELLEAWKKLVKAYEKIDLN